MESPLIALRVTREISQAELAKELKVSPSVLCKWEKGRVPAERVIEVERRTGIARHELRPDIYPPEEAEARA